MPLNVTDLLSDLTIGDYVAFGSIVAGAIVACVVTVSVEMKTSWEDRHKDWLD